MSKITISVSSNGRVIEVTKDFYGDDPTLQRVNFGVDVVAEAAERTFTNRAKGALQSLMDAKVNGETRHSDKEIVKIMNSRAPTIPAKKRTVVDRVVQSTTDLTSAERDQVTARLEAIASGK